MFASNCFFGVCMVHGLDVCFPFSLLVVLDGYISALVSKALKQSWLAKRLYIVMQHDRNIGMYTHIFAV